MKAYLAAPIFTERDRNFNSYLETEILKLCPKMDLYLSQNNASINDKTQCASSADIYVGDVQRLKASDLLICVVSGDTPPIGTTCELAFFSGLCEADPKKRIVALYDDSRDGNYTYLPSKLEQMLTGNAESQWSYINLLETGFLKKWGTICHSSQELIQEVKRQYDIGFDAVVCGIYKITNLKNNKIYIGQSQHIYQRFKSHFFGKTSLDNDIKELGTDYFKYEIVEVCDPALLNEREKYYINFYDSYYTGYNDTDGGAQNNQSQIVSIYDDNGVLIQTFNSINEATRKLNYSSYWNIWSVLNGKRTKAANYRWRLGNKKNIEPYQEPAKTKGTIYAYDKDTRLFIQSFESAAIAAKELSANHSHISSVANGKRRSHMGLIWAYDYFERLPLDYFDKLNIKNNTIFSESEFY